MLIHTCCANCYLHFLENVKNETQDITLLYYNPNIHPRSEWLTRLEALKKVTRANKFELKIISYRPQEFFQKLNQLHHASPDSITNAKTRCPFCWTLRLKKTFEYAKEHDFQQVSTTLLMSQHQDQETIIRIGNALGRKYGIEFIVPKNTTSCHHYCGFYKQNYCGCIYSLTEKLEEKYL